MVKEGKLKQTDNIFHVFDLNSIDVQITAFPDGFVYRN